ncbi:MAG TPA: hypothetical protein VJ553_00790 [Candidatus Paceibacterota bacterium]|nr:hypothetical protein [Candidatus Paceibacterota bacterium]
MISCCAETQADLWWTIFAALSIFELVILASFLLMRRFNARDQRIRNAFCDARQRFMSAADEHRAELADPATFIRVVLLGIRAIEAFAWAREVAPDLHPDADWLNTMRWIELKAKRFELRRG